MDTKDMQKIIDTWIKNNTSGYWKPNNIMMQMMEEVGGLAREINNKYGERPRKAGEEEEKIKKEIADILFTLICLSNSLKIDIEDAFKLSMNKFEKRDKTRHINKF